MRHALSVALAVVLMAPASAVAKPHRPCIKPTSPRYDDTSTPRSRLCPLRHRHVVMPHRAASHFDDVA